MRTGLILLLLLICIPAAAIADTGHKADLDMVIDFGDIFAQFGAMLNLEGGEGMDGEMPEMPSKMEMGGKMAWTDKFMRLDLDPFEGTHESNIIDIDNQISYRLDHNSKTAMRMELTEFDSEAMTGLDMPDPETISADWHGFLEAMNDVEGAVVNELAPRTISGYDCQGFSFVVEMSQPEESAAGEGEDDEEMAAMMGAMMSVMGGYSGEIWVAEEISMPISMTLNTMMMNYTWGLSNIEQTDIPDSMFAVPDDYEVVELEMPDLSEMPDFSEIGEPQPVPEG
jgi:hypothetical protein